MTTPPNDTRQQWATALALVASALLAGLIADSWVPVIAYGGPALLMNFALHRFQRRRED